MLRTYVRFRVHGKGTSARSGWAATDVPIASSRARREGGRGAPPPSSRCPGRSPMKTVRDVMCPVLDVLHTTDSVVDAASYLATHEEESVPFCLADGRLAGTVSNRDIVTKVVAQGLDPRQVQLSALTGPGEPMTLDIDVPVEDAV